MSIEIGVGVLVVGICYLALKSELDEIRTWWKQEQKWKRMRR